MKHATAAMAALAVPWFLLASSCAVVAWTAPHSFGRSLGPPSLQCEQSRRCTSSSICPTRSNRGNRGGRAEVGGPGSSYSSLSRSERSPRRQQQSSWLRHSSSRLSMTSAAGVESEYGGRCLYCCKQLCCWKLCLLSTYCRYNMALAESCFDTKHLFFYPLQLLVVYSAICCKSAAVVAYCRFLRTVELCRPDSTYCWTAMTTTILYVLYRCAGSVVRSPTRPCDCCRIWCTLFCALACDLDLDPNDELM